MNKVEISRPPECKGVFIDNTSKRNTVPDNETICQIKNAYYQVTDGLHGLLGTLDEKDFPEELKVVVQCLERISKTNLERLWMKSAAKENGE